MEILKLDNVIKIYGKNTEAVSAVAGISFSVQRSEFVAVMGASGSGKTTLLNCIATVDNVTAGSIFVDGFDITKMNEKVLADYRKEKLGFIFQEYNLLDTLTVHENISLVLALLGEKPAIIDDKVENVLTMFDIVPLKNKFPFEISGGERQRTACARAIISNPSLIIADEPTGALDSKNSKRLMQLLQKMNRHSGSTILAVTHDAKVASYATRVLFLKDGKLYNELYKGEKSDEQFFKDIVDVTAMQGGERYDD